MASQLFIYVFHVIPFLVFYAAFFFDLVPMYEGFPDYLKHIILFSPIYAVIGLGIYAVFSVVSGVMSFTDCPEAKQELVEEIKEARKDLKSRKIID